MDILYSSSWTGTSCAQHVLGVGAISLAIIAATLGFIAWIATRFGNRATAAENRRLVRWVIGGTGALVSAIVVYVLFLDGPIYREIAYRQNTFTFTGCDGMSPVAVDLPQSDIGNISYRGRWTGGRSSRFVQEIVLGRRDGETFVIPLSRDSDATNHAALARILPPEVIDAYLASLDRRGWERPAAYGGAN